MRNRSSIPKLLPTKCMTYIKRYFLPWFVTFLVIFFLPLLFTSETASDDAIYVIPAMVFVLALLCSGLIFFWNTKWGPQQRKNKMSKSPFTEFYELGFDKKVDCALGSIKDYQVIIRYNWIGTTGKPSVSFEILFNPKKSGRFIPQSAIDELNKKYRKEKIIWFRNFLTKEWDFNFLPPKFESIYSYVERSVELLKLERLEPLTLEQSDEMIPEFERYLEDERLRKRH